MKGVAVGTRSGAWMAGGPLRNEVTQSGPSDSPRQTHIKLEFRQVEATGVSPNRTTHEKGAHVGRLSVVQVRET